MIPYRLMLVSCYKPDAPEGIRCSNQMLAWGLWEEFSKLPHVTMTYQNSDLPLGPQPSVDFTLLHCYFNAPIFKQLSTVRALTTKHIINFMELGLDADTVNHNFTYLPWQSHWAPTEQIKFPYIKSLLDNSQKSEKLPGSVLLDHSWPVELLRSPSELWCSKLHGWLEPLKDSRVIGQLRRNNIGNDAPPDWVRSIPESSYPEYLAQTAPYENFVLTHPGSYEHSVLDMLARGTRVLVPTQGKPFVPQTLVNQLKLPTFQTREELIMLLNSPLEDNWRADLLTDMPEVVRRIDAYCQNEMKKDA